MPTQRTRFRDSLIASSRCRQMCNAVCIIKVAKEKLLFICFRFLTYT